MEKLHIKNLSLLQELTDVETILTRATYRKGEFLFLTGEEADCLYALQKGTVKVAYITPNGEEQILNVYRPGDIFGELFLGQYKHRVGEAQALEDVSVIQINQDQFMELLHRFPQIGWEFIQHLADGTRETLHRLHALMGISARERLLGILLSLARRYCCSQGEWFALPKSITQSDLAKMSGLNRSTVSILINELRRQEVLGGKGRTIKINRAAVERSLENAGLSLLE